MRARVTGALMTIGFLVVSAGGSLWAASGGDACALLSQDRVSEVLGALASAGKHQGPGGAVGSLLSCIWSTSGATSQDRKRVLLEILGPTGDQTPVDRYNNSKESARESEMTPVSGLGDDAFYLTNGSGTNLYMRKGRVVIRMFVFGSSTDDVKAMEKTLAQDAVARL